MTQAKANVSALLDKPASIEIKPERPPLQSAVVVRDLQFWNTEDQSLIQSFVRSAAAIGRASIEHDPRWLDVLNQSMNHRPHLLVAADEMNPQRVRGILPLAFVKSFLFGRFLVSLPYLNRAGIVTQDESVADQLMGKAISLANELNAQHLELRHAGHELAHKAITHTKRDKPCMILGLPDSADALWKQINAKVRNQIRKAEKHDFSVTFGHHELLNDFYNVFAINMRDLGTPVYAKSLFGSILHKFREEAELAVVRLEGKPVAGALLIHDQYEQPKFGRISQVPSASSLRAFNKTNANMWMYHQLLLRAIERGSGGFDFGRSSKDSGTYRFKKQWGAEPHGTTWQYHAPHGEIGNARPNNPKYQRRIELWKKLPVSVSRLFGPRIVRGIP